MKKTVIYDLNNLAIRYFFSSEIGGSTELPEYGLWEYLIVENIYYSLAKFKNVTEVILAVDDKDSWRKVVFPRYKESRKKKRNEDDVDWETFYQKYDELCKTIANYLPFKVLKCSRAEADDTIGILARHIKNEVIVVSNDSDYLQLCDTKKIKVYNPTKQEYSKLKETREDFLTRLTLKGQSKDDIFNTNTPSDYPSHLYRKPGLGDAAVNKILKEGLDEYLDTEKTIKKVEKYVEDGEKKEKTIYECKFKPRTFFDRNRKLIDFYEIPDIVKNNIINEYQSCKLPDPKKFYELFKMKEWKGFLENFDKVEMNLLKLYGEH